MTDCSGRNPNLENLVNGMSEKELLVYAKFHRSIGSQYLINALVTAINLRISRENNIMSEPAND